MRIRWRGSTGSSASLDVVSRHLTAALRDEGADVTPDGPADAAIHYHYARTRDEGAEGFEDGEDPRVGYALIDSTRLAPWAVAALSAVDQVWVPSRFSFEAAVESGVSPARLRVVPHGVSYAFSCAALPLEAISQDPTARRSLRDVAARKQAGQPMVGWVYTHSWERKGGEAVVRLFRRLFEDRACAGLAFVVKTVPEQREMIEKTFARLGAPMSRLTVIAERYSEEEMAAWYRTLAVFVYPTRGGAFELPPLEALASGVATVVPERGPCIDYALGVADLAAIRGMSPMFTDLTARDNGHVGEGFDVDDDALYAATHQALCRGKPRGDSRRLVADWTWGRAARIALGYLAEPPKIEVGVAPRLFTWTSGQEQCGIREYSNALDEGFRALGHLPLSRPLTDREWLRDVRAGDGVLVHYDPGLIEGPGAQAFSAALVQLRRRRARTVLCCHYFDGGELGYRGNVQALALHRDYGIADPICRVIPHGAIAYELGDRATLRRAYGLPDDALILTTCGFLTAWKRIPAVLRALGAALGERPNVHIQVLAGRHFSGCHKSEEPLLRREALALGADRVTVVTAFLPTHEVLDRIAASDLGFLYHGVETNSVSGATKLFVSGRCPLVTTASRHSADLSRGVAVSPSLDLEPFVAKVAEVIADGARMDALRCEMADEYASRTMESIARRYVDLIWPPATH